MSVSLARKINYTGNGMRVARVARSRGRRLVAGAFVFSALSVAASGQIRIAENGSDVHLINSDLAVLEAQIKKKDLPCEVKQNDPQLGFDLRFHTGYDFTIPLKELAGEEDMLTVLFRVTHKNPPDEAAADPAFFLQHIKVPKIEANAGGDAELSGIFDVGEGEYHVDWMMRNRAGRVCADFWDSKAELSSRDREIQMEIAAGAIETSVGDQFFEDPPVERSTVRPLNVKILVNFAPQRQNSSALRPIDTLALVTVLRRITREPQFGKFSLVAFNIQEQRVLYRQLQSDRVDFPALGEAIEDVQPGLVSLKLLANKRGEVEFLVDLIRQEMSGDGTGVDRPDAIIFAGPKAMLEGGVSRDELEPVATVVDFPVFYLNYNLIPQEIPWRDSIGNAIRVFGGREFTITRPRDLWFSVAEMVSLIVESSQGRAASLK